MCRLFWICYFILNKSNFGFLCLLQVIGQWLKHLIYCANDHEHKWHGSRFVPTWYWYGRLIRTGYCTSRLIDPPTCSQRSMKSMWVSMVEEGVRSCQSLRFQFVFFSALSNDHTNISVHNQKACEMILFWWGNCR